MCGVEKNGRIGREVAGAFRQRRHHHSMRDVLIIAETFVVREEVGMVVHHGAADRAAELVLLELFLPRREVVVGIECVVAQELVQRSVDLICAGTGDDGGDAAAGSSELSRCGRGQNAELSHRIGWRPIRVPPVHAVDVPHAVHEKGIGLRTHAVDFIILSNSPEVVLHRQTRGGWTYSRLENAKLREVAPIEWQTRNLGFAHHRALRDLVGLQSGGLSAYLDGLLVSLEGTSCTAICDWFPTSR
jgi:hypothetical protein